LRSIHALPAGPPRSGRPARPRRNREEHRRHPCRGAAMTAPLLHIERLRVSFHGDDGRTTQAVDGLDLTPERGRTRGLVGESGARKSVSWLAVMGLLPKRTAHVSGRVCLDGFEMLDLPDRELRDLRGDRVAMIFQEPMTSLNPSYTIGEQIIETLIRHRGLSQAQARSRCCGACTCPNRKSASTSIHTGCRAACASAR